MRVLLLEGQVGSPRILAWSWEEQPGPQRTEMKGVQSAQPPLQVREGLLLAQGPPCRVHRTGTFVGEAESVVVLCVEAA